MIDYDAWLEQHNKSKKQARKHDANWDLLQREKQTPKPSARGRTRTPVLRQFDAQFIFCYYEHVGYGWELIKRSLMFDGAVYMTPLQKEFKDAWQTLGAPKVSWATPYSNNGPEPFYQVMRCEGEYAVLTSDAKLIYKSRSTNYTNTLGYWEYGFDSRKKSNTVTLDQLNSRLDAVFCKK